MKDLRLLQNLFFFMLVGFSLCAIQACDDDDEDDKKIEDPISLTGTWRYQFSSGDIYLYFGKDGSGWEHEYDEADGGWYEKDHFTYVYDETAKKIIFEWSDGDTETIVISTLSEKKLVLVDFGDEGLNTYELISREEYKTGDEEDEEKDKRLVKILKEKASRYDEDSPLEKYAYIYEFDYNDEGFLSSAKVYDNEGYSETITYEYSENTITNSEVTFVLFNGKVTVYNPDSGYNPESGEGYRLDYGSSNYEQLNYMGEYGYEDNYIVTWEDDKITKIGEKGYSYYDLPFQTYYWYNTYEYNGKTCNGFIDIGILGLSDLFNLDDGKIMSSIIVLVHPELFGLKTNQLPKSSKEDVYVDYYDEETGEEFIYDDYNSYTYTYEFDKDKYLKKVTKTNSETNEYISQTYTWE